MPSSRSMRKKRTLQKGPQGIWLMAVGYAMKARPGPLAATDSTGRLREWAMKPTVLMRRQTDFSRRDERGA